MTTELVVSCVKPERVKVAVVSAAVRQVCLTPSIKSSIALVSVPKPVPANVRTSVFVTASKADVRPVTVATGAFRSKTLLRPMSLVASSWVFAKTRTSA